MPALESDVGGSATLTTRMANFNGTTEVDFGGGATDNARTRRRPIRGRGKARSTVILARPADAPDTVAGTFGAATENASVLGAFGATKQ